MTENSQYKVLLNFFSDGVSNLNLTLEKNNWYQCIRQNDKVFFFKKNIHYSILLFFRLFFAHENRIENVCNSFNVSCEHLNDVITDIKDIRNNFVFTLYDIGYIYEQLLSKNNIMNKGETLGLVFTPVEVVKMMAEQSLTCRLKNCNTVDDVLKLKIIDPAMGVGHMLIACVELCAKRIHQIDHTIHIAECRKMVARSCIYGVDINKLNVCIGLLLLNVQCGTDCNLNIKCNDALLNSIETIFDVDRSFKFDVVIANPPYCSLKSVGNYNTYISKLNLSRLYNTVADEKNDLYTFFVERFSDIVSDELIFILPTTFLNSTRSNKARKKLLANMHIYSVQDLSNVNVFPKHSTYTCIIHCRSRMKHSIQDTQVTAYNSLTTEKWSSTVRIPYVDELTNSLHSLFYTDSCFLTLGPLLKCNTLDKLERILSLELSTFAECEEELEVISFNTNIFKTRDTSQLGYENNNMKVESYEDVNYFKILTAGMTHPYINTWGISYSPQRSYINEAEGGVLKIKGPAKNCYAPFITNEDALKIFDHKVLFHKKLVLPQTANHFRCFYDIRNEFVCPSMTVINSKIHHEMIDNYLLYLTAWFNFPDISHLFECKFAGASISNSFSITPEAVKKVPLPCSFKTFVKDEWIKEHRTRAIIQCVKSIMEQWRMLVEYIGKVLEEYPIDPVNSKFLPKCNMIWNSQKGLFSVEKYLDFDTWKNNLGQVSNIIPEEKLLEIFELALLTLNEYECKKNEIDSYFTDMILFRGLLSGKKRKFNNITKS